MLYVFNPLSRGLLGGEISPRLCRTKGFLGRLFSWGKERHPLQYLKCCRLPRRLIAATFSARIAGCISFWCGWSVCSNDDVMGTHSDACGLSDQQVPAVIRTVSLSQAEGGNNSAFYCNAFIKPGGSTPGRILSSDPNLTTRAHYYVS